MSVELPPPGYPMITRVISHPLFPGSSDARMVRTSPQRQGEPTINVHVHLPVDEPLIWIVGSPHPLVTGMRVVRMFADDGGVEVYSHDDQHGMRNRIPMAMIRLIEEAMPVELLADEISDAEGDEDDEDDELNEPDYTPGGDDDPHHDAGEPPPIQVVPPVPPGAVPNGQATS